MTNKLRRVIDNANRKHAAETGSGPSANGTRQSNGSNVGSVGKEPSAPPEFKKGPLPLTADLRPVPSLVPGMIPAPIREWVQDIAARGAFPLEYPAVAALVSLSAVVGRKVGIRPKRHDDWTVVPNLWGAIVGPAGIQKTPPVEEAMRPLKRLVAEAMERYEEELIDYEARAAVAKARAKAAGAELEKAAKDKRKRDSDLEELARLAKSPEKEKRPVLKRYIANDATVEKLGELLKENPHGLLVFRDELTGFLRSLEKSGHESDRAFYLEAWSGLGSFVWDRIGRGTTIIPAVCISVLGTIQPGPLARYIREAANGDNDGLINRFQAIVFPDPPTEWINVDRYPDTLAKNRAFEIFERLDSLEPLQAGAESDTDTDRGIPFFRFTPEAQQFFDQWRNTLENRLRSGMDNPLIQSHLAKFRSLIPSLALIFHLVEVVDTGTPGPVSLHSLEAAAAWGELFEEHALRAYQSAFDGDVEPALQLAQRIKESLPNPFTRGDVLRKGWSGLDKLSSVQQAVNVLQDRGWVLCRDVPPGPEGGRPRHEVWVHPEIVSGNQGGQS